MQKSISITRISILIAVLILIAGCASTAPKIEDAVEGPDPTNLTVDPRSGALDLRWDTNRHDGSVISGYMIYVAEGDGEFEARNEQPYPGDNNPATAYETYPLEGLENGQLYKVFVTTLYPGEVESTPTNTVESIPRPEGTILLAESFSGSNEGYSFTLDRHVPTDDVDNDLYLAVIDGRVHLASPNRIDYVLRTTRFFDLGAATSIDSIDVSEQPSDPVRLLQVSEGDAILFQDADDSYGLIHVRSIRGGEKRVIELDYIFQSKPNTLIF